MKPLASAQAETSTQPSGSPTEMEASTDPQLMLDELTAVRAIIDRAIARLQAALQSPPLSGNSRAQ